MTRAVDIEGRGVRVNGRSVGGGSAIPDSVVSLYAFEDDSDTTVAVDSEGSNDLNITGATYSTTAKKGSLSLNHDGTDDETISQNTVDLSSAGSDAGLSLAGWIYWDSAASSGTEYALVHDASSGHIGIRNQDGTLQVRLNINGSVSTISGPGVSTGVWNHYYVEVASDGSAEFKIDNSSEGTTTASDPTTIGSGNHITGSFDGAGSANADVKTDDFAPADAPLTSTEIDSLINR